MSAWGSPASSCGAFARSHRRVENSTSCAHGLAYELADRAASAIIAEYARRLGVDLEVSQRGCGEQALEITGTFVRTGAIDLIVVDSIAALTPRAEIEGDMSDSDMCLQTRLMSQDLRKLAAAISRTKTVLAFINQDRARERSQEPPPARRKRRETLPLLLDEQLVIVVPPARWVERPEKSIGREVDDAVR